jgi:integrase
MNDALPHSPTVAAIIADYLLLGTEGNGEDTLRNKRCTLGMFDEAFGHTRIADLRTVDVLRWIHSHESWGPWRKKGVVRTIKAALNWAWRMDLIPKNPLHFLMIQRGERRRQMTEDEYRIVLRNTNPTFRRFFIMLAHSGMRFSEVANLRWPDVDWERRCIVLKKHKTAKKVGKPRIIPLTTVLQKLLEYQLRTSAIGIAARVRPLLADGPVPASTVIRWLRPLKVTDVNVIRGLRAAGVIKHTMHGHPAKAHWFYSLGGATVPVPKGYDFVFRNLQNRPWSRTVCSYYLKTLRDRGLIGDLTLHMARHRWATNALLNGCELPMVSTLLGHSSVSMTEHYTHLTFDVGPLLAAMEQAGEDRTVKRRGMHAVRAAHLGQRPRQVRRLGAIVKPAANPVEN